MKRHLSTPSLALLNAFVAFGEQGGVRRAAQYLGVNHAIVSRHLRTLEAYVGTALIDRTGGGHRLTLQGKTYFDRVRAALQEVADATEALRGRDRCDLVVWCVPGFAYNWLRRRLIGFDKLHPEIELEIRPSDRPPDFFGNEADADIRYIRSGAPGNVPSGVRRLEVARPPVFPVVSPQLAEQIGDRITAPQKLLSEDLLHEEDDGEWRMWLEAQGVSISDERLPGRRLWHAHHTLDAARNGQGIALANPLLLADDLEEGHLVLLNIGGRAATPLTLGGYNLLAREDRWVSPNFVKLRQWLRSAIPGEFRA